MKKEIKANNVAIDIVLVKDLSRLGRDITKVKELINFVKNNNVRLIAINDNYDSIK